MLGMARRAMSSGRAASSSAPAATKRIRSVEKIAARVFCRPGTNRRSSDDNDSDNDNDTSRGTDDAFPAGAVGGNPVTIFASPEPLPKSLQKQLAETCDWESVMVGTKAHGDAGACHRAHGGRSDPGDQPSPTMAFFMPSGEEVSFCAHAAIGGATAMAGKPGGTGTDGSSSSWTFRASMTGDAFRVDSTPEGGNRSGGEERDARSGDVSCRCCLHVTSVPFTEQPLTEPASEALEAWSDRLGWSRAPRDGGGAVAPARNASVARPKTLVELGSVDAVHRAGAPPLPTTGGGDPPSFADACAVMDGSTGVYVYARAPSPENERSYACRQFPRASGYPEDPATGIAAAALAASLRFGSTGSAAPAGEYEPTYDIYQGTAMGRPSLIQVVGLESAREEGSESGGGTSTVSFGLQGLVEIDDRCTIEVG